MASNRILKYAFSILKQSGDHSSMDKTVFSIEHFYACFNEDTSSPLSGPKITVFSAASLEQNQST